MIQPSPYATAFLTERPRDGMDLMQSRIRSGLKLNEELADYLKERAHCEDVYAKSLMKLSKKLVISDRTALGQWTPLWDLLSEEVSQVSTIHAVMAFKLADEIERPLRSFLQQDADYLALKSMDTHFARVAKDYDERAMKLSKVKDPYPPTLLIRQSQRKSEKSKKDESKLNEASKALEECKTEWQRAGRDYAQKYQSVDEHRLRNLKTVIQTFESLQTDQLLKRWSSQVTEAAEQLDVEKEIAAFCKVHSESEPVSDLPASHFDNSLQVRSKKVLSTLISIRRKPKHDSGYLPTDMPIHEETHDNASFFSMNAPSENHEQQSPTSPTVPSAIRAPSITGSVMSGSTQTQQQQRLMVECVHLQPKVIVDAEGYTIPPPDRAAWPEVGSVEDFGSDAGSMMSHRIKIDIRNESVHQEDAAHAAVALTRVASMLKENQSSFSKRPRGRRENLRATASMSPSTSMTLNPLVENQEPLSPFQEPLSVDEISFKVPSLEPLVVLPHIKVHITETLHCLQNAGQVVKAEVWGEVSCVYEGPTECANPVCFRLVHHDTLDQVVPNETYLQPYEDQPGVFQINTDMFHVVGSTTVQCLKYKLRQVQVPLIVKPMWKCEEKQTRLLVKYENQQFNPLHHLFFLTTVNGNVVTAQSIPAGQWMVEQHKMVWPMGDVEGQKEHMLKAKFITQEQGTRQPLSVRFEWQDALCSRLDVAKGEDERVLWAHVSVQKTVRAGKYMAE
ncbi:Muniscin C-terminal mu homology domain-containing protein [Spinellus fusiger]|nr:Muniscin C-terminal mu homology domain-containing protein [Spinellus fusiger]